jgi:hypothetical protein
MGDEPNPIIRWAKMAADEAVWAYETIRESGSEELNYIIDLVTGGHKPGRSVTDEDRDT